MRLAARALHPDAARVSKELSAATGSWQLLRVFETEREHYGWQTAIETIGRIAQSSVKRQTLLCTTSPADPRIMADERFGALIDIPLATLKQDRLDKPAATIGHHDMLDLRESLATLKLKQTELFGVLEAKISQVEETRERQGTDDVHANPSCTYHGVSAPS